MHPSILHLAAQPLSSFSSTGYRQTNNMTSQKTIKFNDGKEAPVYAYGTASKLYRKDAQAAVTMAITEAGVHHIDTAAMYRNEDSVGKAIGLKKNHIFVTTKCKSLELGTTVKALMKRMQSSQATRTFLRKGHWSHP
jgi:diketogulonate reductase-like aldo/keto reductase